MVIEQVKMDLSEADDYLDLNRTHRKRARKVLKTVRSAKRTRDLRKNAGISTRFFTNYRDWLEDKGYLTHKKRKSKGWPSKIPLLTSKGEDLLMFIESPSLDSLGFKVDGGHKGTVEVKPRRGNTFDANQAAAIINLLDSGKSLTVGGPQLHAGELGGVLVLRYEIEGADKSVMKLEEEMWRFIKNVLLTTMGVDGAGEARINSMLPHPPAYWLPLELNWSPDSRYLADIYNAYWKKRLKKNEHERGNISIVPETPEEDPFSGHLFSIEEGVGGSGGALDNLRLGNIPRSVIKEFEGMEGCSIPEDAGMRFVKKGVWEIPDSTPSCRIVSEGNDRLDVYEAGGPYPESGWKVRRNILRKMENLVGESEECRKWLEGRIEQDPNFFMPELFWRKLGFNIESEGTGPVSLPYNTEPRKPKFLEILDPGLLYVLDKIAEEWRKNPASSTATSSRIFSEFIERLEGLQEGGKFYNLWSILRKSSGHPYTEDMNGEFKNIEIFEAIEEAALRYYCEGELTDLSKAYLDLSEGRKNSIEELREAIGKGEYDL